MYQEKFEIDTINFMIIFSFFGSIIYFILEGVGNVIFQSIFSTLLTAIIFRI